MGGSGRVGGRGHVGTVVMVTWWSRRVCCSCVTWAGRGPRPCRGDQGIVGTHVIGGESHVSLTAGHVSVGGKPLWAEGCGRRETRGYRFGGSR
eukprot:1570272-Rhodomonas_salina.1